MKAIKTIYLGMTNSRGSRIKATDCCGNQVTIPLDYALDLDDNHKKAAKALCDKMQWKGKLIMGAFPKHNVHVFTS